MTAAITIAADLNLAELVWKSPRSDQDALVDHASGRRFTYGQLRDDSWRYATVLKDRDLPHGEPVAVVGGNSRQFVAACHGVLLADGVVLPLDPAGTADEWHDAVRRSGARLVLRAAEGAGPDLDTFRPHVVGWDEVAAARPVRPAPTRHGDAPALLLTSSGTQGMPKQVVLTHRNLSANLAQIDLVHRLSTDDVVLGLTPFRHIYGMQMAMNPALRASATLITVPTPFTAANLLEVIERRRITVAYVVPSVLAELARSTDIGRYDTSSLRLVFSGGAPLASSVAQACGAALDVPVVQGYGMTEAGCTSAPVDGQQLKAGTVGIPLPGTEIRFVDPVSGLDVAEGQAGEMWVRGPQISPGHLTSPGVISSIVDDENWLHTGDMGHRDETGHVVLTARLKQLIKYKGHQVAPAELEALLLTHPRVLNAVVVGEPDPVAGELPKALVVVDAETNLDEVLDFVAARVAPHKKIRLIEAVSRIPRSATGKVLRSS